MDKFLIAPLNSGLQSDQKPFLIPDDAFASLNNAYIFRGRVRKRFGSTLMNPAIASSQAQLYSKLAINIGTTSNTGTATISVSPAGAAWVPPVNPGQQFSIGTALYTVYQLGAAPLPMLQTVATATATFNSSTGQVVFAGATPLTPIYYYPSNPVMGITTYNLGSEGTAVNLGTTDGTGSLAGDITGYTFVIGQQFIIGNAVYIVNATGSPAYLYQVNYTTTTATLDTTSGAFVFAGAPFNEPVYFYPYPAITVAFDTQFAYAYTTSSWERLGGVVFTGSDSNFFWAITARGAGANNRYLFVTNGTANDSIWYYTGITWTQYRPVLDTTPNLLYGGLLLVFFKERLIVLNTWEGTTAGGAAAAQQYPNRIRWSQFNIPVTAATSFLLSNSNNSGSFFDIPTAESIVSCNIIKDRLIIFCEESTWELVSTGNQSFPFRVQQINRELGVESTFSSIVFDKVILGVGETGIHACNGANVERIDQKIPYQVFQINNENNGQARVAGIRDYYNEMVYWIYPQASRSDVYPSKILIFNYRTGSWATADDSITALGYFNYQTTITWSSLPQQWQQTTSTWGAASFQNQFRSVLAGNQQGVLFVLQNDETANANALSITNISTTPPASFVNPYLTIINHNLVTGDYIYIDNIQGTWSLLNGQIFQVARRVDANTIYITVPNTGVHTYDGGGTISLVSNINIKTKQYSFYAQDMAYSYTHRAAFNVDSTANGQIQVDFYVSSGDEEIIADSQGTGALVSTGVLETTPFTTPNAPNNSEVNQQRLWHYVYLQAEGEYLQYVMYFTDAQMRNIQIARNSDFQLNAVAFYAQKTRLI